MGPVTIGLSVIAFKRDRFLRFEVLPQLHCVSPCLIQRFAKSLMSLPPPPVRQSLILVHGTFVEVVQTLSKKRLRSRPQPA